MRIPFISSVLLLLAVATVTAETSVDSRLESLERRLRSVEATPRSTTDYPTAVLGGVTRLTWADFREGGATRAAVGQPPDGVTFRTTRLWAKGQLASNVGYQTELDFAQPGRPSFQNAYLELQQLPSVGTLRLGRWKQPFSLETMTSIRFLTFAERASLFALVPFRKTGAGVFDTYDDGLGTWAVSVHRASDDNFGNDVGPAGGTAVTARATRLLDASDGGEHLVHLGLAAHTADPSSGLVRFNSTPELALGAVNATNTPSFVDTGNLRADDVSVLGLEAAYVNGPFSLQAEAARAEVDRAGGPSVDFPAAYVFASWFLTGEHRNYNRAAGAFDRVAVKRPFHAGRGGGAWELAARWSVLDLNDRDVRGNRLENWTFGLNWYINSRSRVLLNHVVSDLELPAGDDTTHATAVQVVFDF